MTTTPTQPGNVTLLGMPASGKSTVGRLLAASLNLRYIDTDHVLETTHRRALNDLVARYGREAFLDLERDAVLALTGLRDAVIAPGGSVIYRPAAIDHLREISTVVYLDVPLESIEQRIGSLAARGVILPPGTTLADLYAERTPRYAAAAHHHVECAGTTPEQATARVRDAMIRTL